jgi:FMN reductase
MGATSSDGPRVVAIGGSARPGSTTEQLLRMVAAGIGPGAQVTFCCGPDLLLPPYAPGRLVSPAARLVAAVQEADAVLIGSPGYHGSMSGSVKNVLDYLESLSVGEPAYLDGKVVGCVATAAGWQAAVNTLGALRQVAQALRGWCTPYGIAVNVADGYLDAAGALRADRLAPQVDILAAQIRQFLYMTGRLATQPA